MMSAARLPRLLEEEPTACELWAVSTAGKAQPGFALVDLGAEQVGRPRTGAVEQHEHVSAHLGAPQH